MMYNARHARHANGLSNHVIVFLLLFVDLLTNRQGSYVLPTTTHNTNDA
jgi:hypothetical protein